MFTMRRLHAGVFLLVTSSLAGSAWAQPAGPPPSEAPPPPASPPPPTPTATASPAPAPAPAPAPTPAPPPAAPSAAPHQAAQPPAPPAAASSPPADDRWWESYHQEPASGVAAPISTVGIVLTALGAGTVFASGITWIVAAANASRVHDDCDDVRKVCYEGTRGADALETARDASAGAIVLLGIGVPVLAGGVVLAALGGTARDGQDSAIRVVPTGTGLVVEGSF